MVYFDINRFIFRSAEHSSLMEVNRGLDSQHLWNIVSFSFWKFCDGASSIYLGISTLEKLSSNIPVPFIFSCL